MRVVSIFEKRQRGCQYCTEVGRCHFEGTTRTGCPHAKCPFDVLDNYKSYEEYMESPDCKIQVTEFFKSVHSFCNYIVGGRSSKHVFSDGDDRVDL